MYGITETTVHVTYCPLRAADIDPLKGIAIGRPLPDLQVYVLDSGTLQPMPIGVPGELYVGGCGLARGYLGRPGLTATRFIPDPFGEGGRLYRTGDAGRWRADGHLEYLGRLDHQVKVRGHRIEPGEIELALRSHAGLRHAVLAVREDVPGDRRLVAYVVGAEGSPVDVIELRTHLRQWLPDYMIPSAFVVLDDLPLTENGKIDRKALPAPDERPDITGYVAPRTATEQALADIWSQVLRVSPVGIHDDFFALCGT